MKVSDICKAVLATKGCRLGGKTPAATLAAIMYTHPDQFVKLEPGLFTFNPDYERTSRGTTARRTKKRS